MTSYEFSAELLALFVRAQERRDADPEDKWWPIVVDALKTAIVAAGSASMYQKPKPLPHIKPLTVRWNEFEPLNGRSKGP